jgi:hypothetical protein
MFGVSSGYCYPRNTFPSNILHSKYALGDFFRPWTAFVLRPPLRLNEKLKIMNQNPLPQLELELNQTQPACPIPRRPARAPRALWWFDRMRQIVDRAMDWPPAPPCRPEQTWFPTPVNHQANRG